MTSDAITRPEYEARQSEMRAELIRLATENNELRRDVQAKFDVLSAKMDTTSLGVWKMVAASVVNFMLGGGLVALLNYLHFPH